MTNTVLIVDDDAGILSALQLLLKAEGFAAVSAESPQQAMAAINRQDFSLVLMDLNYSLDTTSGDEGLKLISEIRKLDELLPIVVMTGWGTIEVAVNSMRQGANDFVQKPWENDRLLSIINNQIKLAQTQKQSQKLTRQNELLTQEFATSGETIACSPAMKQLMSMLQQVAASDVNVLLTGENGTGKSLLARYIHQLSPRRDAAMISVNMGAVTESLFESEMFGHVKGAFTDAKSTRIGRFELADGGSLFLDEIANTPYSQQAKLLRVLEERQFEKVGSSRTQSADIRLISATNADLDEAVTQGLFRKDLRYRINTLEIEIPPLRKRTEDIVPLANSFLAQLAGKYAKPVLSLSDSAKAALIEYSWPGNVRELNHVMERAHILCRGEQIDISELGLNGVAGAKSSLKTERNETDLRPIEVIEMEVIQQRLNYYSGNAIQAAQSLGLSRSAFYRRLDKVKS